MSEYDALIAELAAFRAFLTERGCGGVGDANGMHDLAQHHEELIADNERQAARIARLETALRQAQLALDQAQDCILYETPEFGTREEARDDAVETIRAADRAVAAALADAPGKKL